MIDQHRLNRAVKRTVTSPWRRLRNVVGAVALAAALLLGTVMTVNMVRSDGEAAGCYSYPARTIAFSGEYRLMQDYPYARCQWWVYVPYWCYYPYPIAYGPPQCFGGGGGSW